MKNYFRIFYFIYYGFLIIFTLFIGGVSLASDLDWEKLVFIEHPPYTFAKPRFSPDGQKLLYRKSGPKMENEKFRSSSLCINYIENNKEIIITEVARQDIEDYCWLNDSIHLVYTLSKPIEELYHPNIYFSNCFGAKPQPLKLPNGYRYSNPRPLSEDQYSVGILGERKDNGKKYIFFYHIKEKKFSKREVPKETNSFLFGSTSNEIIFDAGKPDWIPNRIYYLNISTSQIKEISSDAKSCRLEDYCPKGNKIVYVKGYQKMCMFYLDTFKEEVVLDASQIEEYKNWAFQDIDFIDGERVVFELGVMYWVGEHLCIYNLSSGDLAVLDTTGAYFGYTGVHPDGQLIAYTRASNPWNMEPKIYFLKYWSYNFQIEQYKPGVYSWLHTRIALSDPVCGEFTRMNLCKEVIFMAVDEGQIWLTCFDLDGKILWTRNLSPLIYKANGKPYPLYCTPIVVADIDGDKLDEIAVGIAYPEELNYGMLFLIDDDGQYINGWPKKIPGVKRIAGLALGNLDGKEKYELVAGVFNIEDKACLLVFGYSGKILLEIGDLGSPTAGIPVLSPSVIGEKTLNILLAVDNKLYVWDYAGHLLPGWPQNVVSSQKPSVGDLDGDKKIEIVQFPTIFNFNGSIYKKYQFDDKDEYPGPATLADIDKDGDLEIILFRGKPVIAYPGWSNKPIILADGGICALGAIYAYSHDSYYPMWKYDGFSKNEISPDEKGIKAKGLRVVIQGEVIKYPLPIVADLKIENSYPKIIFKGSRYKVYSIGTGTSGSPPSNTILYQLEIFNLNSKGKPFKSPYSKDFSNVVEFYPIIGDIDNDRLTEVLCFMPQDAYKFGWKNSDQYKAFIYNEFYNPTIEGQLEWAQFYHDSMNNCWVKKE